MVFLLPPVSTELDHLVGVMVCIPTSSVEGYEFDPSQLKQKTSKLVYSAFSLKHAASVKEKIGSHKSLPLSCVVLVTLLQSADPC